MSQVTAQIATEKSEKAVELRDKGDIAGARKVLEDNADLHQAAPTRATARAPPPAPAASIEALNELEKQSREAASNLDGDNWNHTRKAMRYDQHKSKVQQAY